jgi:hypothetical protein
MAKDDEFERPIAECDAGIEKLTNIKAALVEARQKKDQALEEGARSIAPTLQRLLRMFDAPMPPAPAPAPESPAAALTSAAPTG